MKRITVIDTSFNSMANIDYEAAKRAGVDGVILHAGFGSSYGQRDAYFDEAYNKAIQAGLMVGAYWFDYFRDEDDARTEAGVFNSVIEGKRLDLGVFFDYEEDTIRYLANGGYSLENITARLVAAMEQMRAFGWDKVYWYSNPHCINGANGADALDMDRLADWGLWLAKFDGDPDNWGEWGNVVGKQYANADMLPDNLAGLGNIDASVFDVDGIGEDETLEWTHEQAEGVVRGLYRGLLRRDYNSGENEGLVQSLMRSMTRIEAFNSIVASDEYEKKRVIIDCYLATRGSLPSNSETDYWFNQSIDDIKSGILYSEEFNNNFGV
jgi:GH25 family lysozyme M1 (1,4-beta-N-acetylmuramidase)